MTALHEAPALRGYEILAEVGRGGLAVVYKARQIATGRVVALKMLTAGGFAGDTDRLRFRAEAETLASLDHPNIVRILEVGELNGLPYFTLEYMDRGSLARALGNSPLPPLYAAEMLIPLCGAVQAAHDRGILHRDINPANVLLGSQEGPVSDALRLLGVPKLTDFGLARQVREGNRLTRTGAIMGTPAYMAPEQAEGHTREATRAVDVYALGAVLYECLTGKPPYDGPTVLETLDLVRQGDPPPPDRLVPELPASLVNICLKAMARDPDARYGSAAEMAADLRRFLEDQPVQARREPTTSRFLRWARRRPTVAVLSACLAVVSLAFLLALVALLGRKRPAPIEPDTAHLEYYGSVIRRWGMPEGVNPLTLEQVQRREVSFRFLVKGGKTLKVEALGRLGRPTTAHSFVAYLERGESDRPWRRECRWEYQYDDKGNLSRETALDRTGQIVWAFRYEPPPATTGHYTDKRGFPRPRAGSGAAFVSFAYFDSGLVRELRYLGSDGRARPDRNGIFGQRHEHDERGFVTRVAFLGHGDQEIVHPDGYAREVREYDERGNRTVTAYLGLDDRPTLGPSGQARRTATYDLDGNVVEVRAFGLDGKLIRRREGFAIEKRGYDKTGRLIRVENFDTEGKLIADWLRVARTEYTYSEGGRRREESFFGADGKPARHRILGCTQLGRMWDEEGHETEVAAKDLDFKGRRDMRFSPPSPIVRRKHDERGNVTEESYFTADGKRTLSWFGVHKMLTRFDERGHRVEMRFEDLEGKPAVPVSKQPEPFAGRGPSLVRWTWDGDGNNTRVEAFALDGKADDGWNLAILLAMGYREGETPLPPGVARMECEFDKRGNRKEIASLDATGKVLEPVRGRQGVTRGRLVVAYDEHGNVTSAYLHGRDGKLATGVGPSGVTVQYDEDGRPKEYALFGPEGRFAQDGIHRYSFTYDRQGNRIGEEFHDVDGRPVACPSGYARSAYRYDEGGNLTESQYYDKDGNPVAMRVVAAARDALTPPPPFALESPPVPLQPGDVLLTYSGTAIISTIQLHDIKRREDAGREPRPMEVLRGGIKLRIMLPAGFPGGDPFGEFRRRNGRGPGGNPFWFIRSLPGQGFSPPLVLGDIQLRMEVAP